MRMIVRRTVRQLHPEAGQPSTQNDLSLRHFRDHHGYVLMGEAGIGKSTEFRKEAMRVSANDPIPARYFLEGKLQCHPEWRNGPIFIDDLDQVRVHSHYPNKIIDQMIKRLEALGNPPFRISCRSNSWLRFSHIQEFTSLGNDCQTPVLQLNPLSVKDVNNIISEYEKDPTHFVPRAYEYQLNTFLFNPLLIKILLVSVETGRWPKTPMDVLEKACQELISENNTHDSIDHPHEFMTSKESILSAAGELCVMMLIGNKFGWTKHNLNHSEESSLNRMNTFSSDTYSAALKSWLFQGGSQYYTPSHRLLAEFLGARYLARRIKEGLSIKRAVTLFTDSQGEVFPDLKGLATWLSVFAPTTRSSLMRLDPVSLALDGDISKFSAEDRKVLLRELSINSHSFQIWPSSLSIEVISGHHGISFVSELAKSSDRSSSSQTLMEILLNGVSSAHNHTINNHHDTFQLQVGDTKNVLITIIRDSKWGATTRCAAIHALNELDLNSTMLKILKDLDENQIIDESGDLRNILLHSLYPFELQPSEIWNYLPPFRGKSYIAYKYFFSTLIIKSENEHIKELLDALTAKSSEVIHRLDQHQLAYITLILLNRGLELYGTQLEINKIYQWFELVDFDKTHSLLVPKGCSCNSLSPNGYKANKTIRNWLNEHPDIQYQLIEYGLHRNKSQIGTTPLHVTLGLKFVDKNANTGFRSWCLTRSVQLFNTHPKLAKELGKWSTEPFNEWGAPLCDEEVLRVIHNTKGLFKWNTQRLNQKEKQRQPEVKSQNRLETIHNARGPSDVILHMQKHVTDLSEGRYAPAILDKMATLYFQGGNEKLNHPLFDLELYLDRDNKLLEAALSGFRNLLSREDLPDLSQIATYHEKMQRSLHALPFLAGMEEEGDNAFSTLNEIGKRRAVGLLFVTERPHLEKLSHSGTSNQPITQWYEYALENHPDIVAEAMVAVHRACVRSKRQLPNPFLLKMIDNQVYSKVAHQLAISKMFSVFPTRCNGMQIKSLVPVLWIALVYGLSKPDLKKNIIQRLERKNMDTAQRSIWICAGLLVAKDHCLPYLTDFLRGKGDNKIQHVSNFFNAARQETMLNIFKSWSNTDLSQFILTIGRCVPPPITHDENSRPSSNETWSTYLSALLQKCLNEIANCLNDDAMNELKSLVSHPELSKWRQLTLRSQQEQTMLHRAEHRKDLNLMQIQSTIKSSHPSSDADLAALSIDIIEDLNVQLQSRKRNLRQTYWNLDPINKDLLTPQTEEICRDQIVTQLQLMLKPFQVEAQSEEIYSDDRIAHIRISYRSTLSVPIIIKHNHHRKIWRSVDEQLVSKYFRDYSISGHGIYLVFWFGMEYMRVPLPNGQIPKRPEQLKHLLLQQIDPKAKNHISVIIIDVSL